MYCTPNGIRTRVTCVKGRRPGPLDDGGPPPSGARAPYRRGTPPRLPGDRWLRCRAVEGDGGAAEEPGQFPLRRWLDFDVQAIQPGVAVATIDVGDRHHNPNGVLHGGVAFTMVDTAMGAATMSVLDDGLACASIDVALRYLRPCVGGPVTVTAHVLRPGRRVVHLEARVVDADERLLATAAGSFAVLDPATA